MGTCRRLLVAALAALLFLPSIAIAELASRTEAELVAGNWLAYLVHEQGTWAGEPAPRIARTDRLTSSQGTLLAYCCAVSPAGYVVVPVLKELPPVKAYSEAYDFDVAREQGFVQLVRERLELQVNHFAEIHGGLDARQPATGHVPFPRRHRLTWQRLLVDPEQMTASLIGGQWPRTRDAGPLLSTAWHQQSPFNDYCPLGDGGRCVVGCVATAAAQVLNYHQWPAYGFGEHSYWWNGDQSCGGSTPGDTLEAVFWDPYDWQGMPGAGGGREDAAVAELCYEVGVAYQMSYGRCGSYSSVSKAVTVLPRHFRYDDSICYEYGSQYSSDDWFAMIQVEIDSSRPILYAYPGHAIVCDGWRIVGSEKQIHLNYGWGGGHDGWYAMDDIYGHSGGHESERLVRNVFPDPAIIINAEGTGDYPTIQAAVAAASPGEVIKLQDGTYTGPGNRDVGFQGKALTVRSQSRDPSTCIIDAQGSPLAPHRCFVFGQGEGPASVLEDVWVTGGWAAEGGGGIVCLDATPTISGCLITGNESPAGGGGIACAVTVPVLPGSIRGCTIAGNTGGGLLVVSYQPLVQNTIFHGNTGLAAVLCQDGGYPLLSCCDIWGNPEGDWTECIAGQLGINGNLCLDPLFCDPWDETILTLSAPSCCLPENNSCGVLIGALGQGCSDYLVYPDGSGFFPTIQAAVDSAVDGADILLADGTYTGPGNRDIDSRGKVFTVRSVSEDAGACVIDCEGSPASPHRAFVFAGGSGTCRLQYLTITGGNVPGEDGGAVLCSGDGMLQVHGCRLTGNAAGRGGALAVDTGAGLSLSLSEISLNSAAFGGGVHGSGALGVSLSGCTVVANLADTGSGVCVSGGSLTLAQSILAFGSGDSAVRGTDVSVNCYCSDVYGNEGGDWIDCLTGFLGVDGNICADPQFCDFPGGDYHLTEGSPCTDMEECMISFGEQMGAYGVGCTMTGSEDVPPIAAREFDLSQNFPNPFNPGTRFTFTLPAPGKVRLAIFDIGGRLVRRLVDQERPAGTFTERWDGRDGSGAPVAAGVYLARLEQGGRSAVRKLVVVK